MNTKKDIARMSSPDDFPHQIPGEERMMLAELASELKEELRKAAAPGSVLIDPRDGCHYRLNQASQEEGDDAPARFIALPELDVASAQTTAQRQLLALRELSASARAAFDADAVDPVRSHRYRLRKVRLTQKSHLPLNDPRAFGPLVVAVCRQFRGCAEFTREAVAPLQAATEHFLVDLLEDTNLTTIRARNIRMFSPDLSHARRVRKGVESSELN